MTGEEGADQKYKREDNELGVDVLLTDNSCVNYVPGQPCDSEVI